jgi:hypothetical protein
MRVGNEVCAIRDDEKMLNMSLEVNSQLQRKGDLLFFFFFFFELEIYVIQAVPTRQHVLQGHD